MHVESLYRVVVRAMSDETCRLIHLVWDRTVIGMLRHILGIPM